MVSGALMRRDTLDPIGQYYASLNTPQHPGQFLLAAYWHEKIDPAILRQAVDDVVRRLPFLSGRLHRGFFGYAHEWLDAPVPVVKLDGEYRFTDYYNQGAGHVFRVLYGERHFMVEAIHTVVDGRGLARVLVTLAARYVELLGVKFDKTGLIDCDGVFHPSEWENAYARFYNPSAEMSSRWDADNGDSYCHPNPAPAAPRVLLKTYPLGALKDAAKVQGATISEYILAQIFLTIAAERNACRETAPITALLPIDGRRFFPTQTIRNCVDSLPITMPETHDIHVMLADMHPQFSQINEAFVQANINGFEGAWRRSRFVPRVLRRWILRRREAGLGALTTTFSNVGKLVLPLEVAARLSHVAFILDADEEHMPLTYAAAAVGDVLTLAFTLCMESDTLVREVDARLRGEKKFDLRE